MAQSPRRSSTRKPLYVCPGNRKKKEEETKEKKGKKLKRRTSAENDEDKNSKNENEGVMDEFAKARLEKQQCQKLWEESWEKKLRDDERMEEYKACLAPNEFFKKPKLQENIWVQVKQEKNIQQVQMTFRKEPIPPPPCPPYPK